MRRFDREYRQLHGLVRSRDAGELLMVRAVHRNAFAEPGFKQPMLITDAVVHEFDVIPWLAGSTIRTVEVKYPRRNSLSPADLREPILVVAELENGVLIDIEMSVGSHFGYQVTTEAVFERGVARIGQPEGMQRWQDGEFKVAEHQTFKSRFRDAYDQQVQRWVNAAKRGTIDGPNAWDGYCATLACEAGVEALTGGVVPVKLPARPDFYI